MPHPPTALRTFVLTSMAMIAFAGNSLLCRLALKESAMDAASFTSIRLLSGAAVLWLLLPKAQKTTHVKGTWTSALALFIYAAGFSFAYQSLPTAIGALILFAAVQATMIGYGIWAGERLQNLQLIGLGLAFGGLIGLLYPGLSAPPLIGSLFMLAAGVAWGFYSLRGRGSTNPMRISSGNFLRASALTLVMSLCMRNHTSINATGVYYALASGAFASGIGYTIWYMALPHLKATNAATIQLTVPILAALGGIIILSEPITLRVLIASLAILGGIALVLGTSSPTTSPTE